MMIPYQNGNSKAILGYEIGEDYIIVYFKNRYSYKFSYKSCGSRHVNNMIAKAINDKDLTKYFGKNQYDMDFDWKIRY